jgi:hypothetical protein
MLYQPIENYGIIGNMCTVDLAGMSGSVDWVLSINFDSPSVFRADARGVAFPEKLDEVRLLFERVLDMPIISGFTQNKRGRKTSTVRLRWLNPTVALR